MKRPTPKLLTGLGVLAALAAVSLSAFAQGHETKPAKVHRVVFEVSVDGPEAYQAVLNNVENLQKAFGPKNTQIEVVGHGKGLTMMLAKDEKLTERMKGDSDSGVVFAACSNTMKRQNVDKSQLVPFARVVDSGVAEVVRRQEEGWSYLKGGF